MSECSYRHDFYPAGVFCFSGGISKFYFGGQTAEYHPVRYFPCCKSAREAWNVRLLIRGQNQVELTHISRQLLTILNMVNLQEDVAIAADMSMTPERLHPNVVKRPLTPNNTQRQIGLAVKDAKFISPAARAFIQLAQEMFYFDA